MQDPKRPAFSTGGWQSRYLLAALILLFLFESAVLGAVLAGSEVTNVMPVREMIDNIMLISEVSPGPDAARQRQEIRQRQNQFNQDVNRRMMVPQTTVDWLNKLSMLPAIALTVALIVWTYHAYLNLGHFPGEARRFSSLWAALGFIIPFVQLVLPFLVLSEIWKVSSGKAGVEWKRERVSKRLIIWWGFYVLSIALGLAAGATIFISSYAATVAISVHSISIMAFVLPAILFVRSLEKRQAEVFARLCPAAP